MRKGSPVRLGDDQASTWQEDLFPTPYPNANHPVRQVNLLLTKCDIIGLLEGSMSHHTCTLRYLYPGQV